MPIMRFLPNEQFSLRGDTAPGRHTPASLILKLLALAVCYALAADADASEPTAMRVLATNVADSSTNSPTLTRFGEPRVRSALGEPLDVSIPLLGDPATIAAEARYALGQPAGDLGLPNVRNANIRVVRDAAGWALRVRSDSANHEPVLALVIQERLPTGTHSRVLPLLFDPAGTPAAAVPAPMVATPAPTAMRRAPPGLKIAVTRPPKSPLARHPRQRTDAVAAASPPPLKLSNQLSPVSTNIEAHRESMRWLRRALLEEEDRASLLAVGRRMSQLVAQVEAMEARIAAMQPRPTSHSASAPPTPPMRVARRPG